MVYHSYRLGTAKGIWPTLPPQASIREVSTSVRVQTSPTLRAMMDNVTLIRVVSGIAAIVIIVILVYRFKKKAPR